MRALMVVSVSFETAMWPWTTWSTNSFTRSRPRSRSRVNRPSSTIWSRSLVEVVSCAAGAAFDTFAASAIAASLVLIKTKLGSELLTLFGVAYNVVEHLVELVVALQASTQIGEIGSEVEQFLEGLDFGRDLFGLEIGEFFEVEVHLQLAAVIAELVVDGESEVWTHFFEHLIEVVGIYLHKLAIRQPR